ncbi:MAG: class I SAM-dependent methyltransferase [Gammaproteobacteria bacterium]|nr:class I SAM-dependent methyltransferase [Gammaproteobacteria bacterium]
MDLQFLQRLREYELELVLPEFTPGTRVLEIGAGTGWQAKALAEHGCDVEAIDLESSGYRAHRVWPVTEYDGRRIPFPDGHFDFIYSSSVLEHIPHLADFQQEMRRVLKNTGTAIHIVPAASWRLWTNLTHYPFVAKYVFGMLAARLGASRPRSDDIVQLSKHSRWDLLKGALFPPRHGEIGNALTELYHFSQLRWCRDFEASGWRIASHRSNEILYSGYMLFGPRISIDTRRSAARVLGGVCHIYRLEKQTLDSTD